MAGVDDEGRFTFLSISNAGDTPAEIAASWSGPFAVGTAVRVVAGRARGATAEILELVEVPTPAGFTAHVARIRRPRGGESWELLTNLTTITPIPG